MSKKEKPATLEGVRMDVITHNKDRRHTHGPSQVYEDQRRGIPKVSSKSSDFVYVNQAYHGNLNSASARPQPVTTTVYREQYWTCSKWPFAQKILAAAVGLLLGTVIGLVVTMAIRGKDAGDVIGGIFRTLPAPD